MTEIQKQRASGRIEVTNFEEVPLDNAGAFSISQANVTEEFAGDLVGIGSVRFIMAKGLDGATNFTGIDHFLGKIGGRSGSFLFVNSGMLNDGDLRSVWRVVEASGTEELSGLRGEGGCTPEGFWLDYWFE